MEILVSPQSMNDEDIYNFKTEFVSRSYKFHPDGTTRSKLKKKNSSQ